jgi:alkylation response protein AidB-like acyl-CoA dehydrogenase
MVNDVNEDIITQIIKDEVQPYIGGIDRKGYYPEKFLKAIGKAGLLNSNDLPKEYISHQEVRFIEKTANYCMTSAFILWCHLAALSSVRMSSNPYIKKNLLPLLESGEILGGTGLSNALKYYAGLEAIRLKAVRTDGGYIISGSLPSVSNLGSDHWFTILASNNKQQVMGIIPVKAKGLRIEEKTGLVGLNGSKTFSCFFNDVFLPDKWVITEETDQFIQQLRPTMALYQIPLGLGVTAASIRSIFENRRKSVEEFQFLKVQPEELERDLQQIRKRTFNYAKSPVLESVSKDVLLTRLEIVHLASKAVHADMLYSGGQAYLNESDPFRRLRESYFLVNLTPTVKQLEKLR